MQKDTYLRELSRYIVLNPVRARMVHMAKDWRWSNYRATAGMRETPGWLETDRVLSGVAEHKLDAQQAYRRFVAEGRNQLSPWEELKNQIYLGSEVFIDMMQRKLDGNQCLSEIPKTQRRAVASHWIGTLRNTGLGTQQFSKLLPVEATICGKSGIMLACTIHGLVES